MLCPMNNAFLVGDDDHFERIVRLGQGGMLPLSFPLITPTTELVDDIHVHPL